MIGRLGLRYDLRNILDLLLYFFPTPPVPVRWRRRMIAFGSGDPTRAICSSLIAQAFQAIRYPILPEVRRRKVASRFARQEVYHIRHHSPYTPRDFDLSPYFRVLKPTLEQGFNHRDLVWAQPPAPRRQPSVIPARADGSARKAPLDWFLSWALLTRVQHGILLPNMFGPGSTIHPPSGNAIPGAGRPCENACSDV